MKNIVYNIERLENRLNEIIRLTRENKKINYE